MDDVQVAAIVAATLIAADPQYGEFEDVVEDHFHSIRHVREALVGEGLTDYGSRM